jgi:hypothetical protein
MATTKPKSNGWKNGYDPALRILRIVTAVTVLAVFVILALDPTGDDLGTLALAVGTVLILLGYESVVRLPWLQIQPRQPAEPEKKEEDVA